jgi:hypothetical protein
MNKTYIIAKTEQLVSDITRYLELLQNRLLRHGVPNTIDKCNDHWLDLDSFGADLVLRVFSYRQQQWIPSFNPGKPLFEFGDGSTIRRKCCNCPNNPVPAATKANIRAMIRIWLIQWCELAKAWIRAGYPETGFEDTKQEPANNLTQARTIAPPPAPNKVYGSIKIVPIKKA